MNEHTRIKVLLVDDDKIIHDELGAVLVSLPDIWLVGKAFNGEQALALCRETNPDVVLMDISMPVMNGIAATRAILTEFPHVRLLALTGMDDSSIIKAILQAGAAGYILKQTHPEELAHIIRATHQGQTVLSNDVMTSLLQPPDDTSGKPSPDYGLTRRERDILQALATGLNNSEVAAKLGISTPTVRFHITNIIEKLGAKNRAEALVIAARAGLV